MTTNLKVLIYGAFHCTKKTKDLQNRGNKGCVILQARSALFRLTCLNVTSHKKKLVKNMRFERTRLVISTTYRRISLGKFAHRLRRYGTFLLVEYLPDETQTTF